MQIIILVMSISKFDFSGLDMFIYIIDAYIYQ